MSAVAELIVVTGPPGVGKTTVSRVLSGMFALSARVAGDDYFGFIDRGYLAPWTQAAHRQNEVVVSAAAAAAGLLVTGGYTVVYDGVVGPWLDERSGDVVSICHRPFTDHARAPTVAWVPQDRAAGAPPSLKRWGVGRGGGASPMAGGSRPRALAAAGLSLTRSRGPAAGPGRRQGATGAATRPVAW